MAVAPPFVKTPTQALAALAVLAGLAGLAVLAGCASHPPSDRAARGAPPAPRGPIVDASYDWHGQVIVPFGVLLKSSPVPLHEVLLFRDDANKAEAENRDCYAIDGTPPRLVGQTPDSYLLCFDHDRLNRIESTVHLPAENAAQLFAQACAYWQSGAPIAGVCAGQSGATTFTAHLAGEPGEAAALSLVLMHADPAP